ncbi:MAG: ABC transporter permease [Prevotellaceae bacterium]|jgi:putative ABC transport system permease protein|nr:ABC transporter permease [Prevotellaceae bacterium]
MFYHYLKIALRNLLKNKIQSAISIVGLVVGFVCITLSTMWIRYETTYDKQHPNAENIYCLVILNKNNPDYCKSVIFGKDVQRFWDTYPEIEKAANIGIISWVNVQNAEGKVIECYGTEPHFFDVFSIPFVLGDKETALAKPYSIVLNERTATELFGSPEQAIGKVLKSTSHEGNNPDYTVTAVIKNLEHSNLKTNALIPFSKLERDEWEWDYFLGYLVLKNNINKKEFFAKLEQADEHGRYYKAVPIPEIQYKYNYYGLDRTLPFNYNYIVILVLISFLLFVCAIINHISIFISFTYTRLKDLGLRKAIGASAVQLFLLLVTEFIFTLLLAFILGACVIETLRPVLENITLIAIDIPQMIGIITLLMILGALLSVLLISIPFWRICTQAVKQNMTDRKPMGQQRTQKILVSIQLIISIFFLFITSIMYLQMRFIAHKDLGMNIKNVIKITPNASYSKIFTSKAHIIADKLKQNEHITAAFIQGRDFFLENGNKNFLSKYLNWEGKNPDFPDFSGTWIEAQPELVDFFGIKIIEGRFFSKDFANENDKIVIDKKFAEIIGNPIGKILSDSRQQWEIIGVIESIQDRSLKHESRPTILEFSNNAFSFIYIRYAGNKAKEALELVDKVLKEQEINNYNAAFMEDTFKGFTKADSIMMHIISVIAATCLIISAFGVYSLTLYSMARRKREVAIRKIMGADITEIIRMFIKEYLWLVLIACIIAVPSAHYCMDKWLQNYANRINISWWFIACIIIVVTGIVILTVLRQIVKAANSNPSDIIKYE